MHIVKFLVCLTGIAMTYVLVGCSRTSEPAPPAAAPAPAAAAAPAQATSAGTGTIADLGGPSWTLTSFDEGEPVPDGVNIYLAVDGDKVSGQGGCNRYMGSISNGDAPGTLKFGPLAMTRMACNPPADQAEQRYSQALQNASAFEVADGTLRIHYLDGDVRRTLTYRRG